jgi:two-component system, NarL family, response regulator LiaR
MIEPQGKDVTRLSQREREVAELVATGAANKEIARQLRVSEKTIKNTLTKVFAKTNTRSRTELAIQIIRAEYFSPVSLMEHLDFVRAPSA